MISIIGAGRVGSVLGFLVASTSLDDVVLVNRSRNKASGEALDIVNTVPHGSSVSVTGTDDLGAIAGSDVVVVAVGAGKMVTDRADLIPYTVPIMKEMAKKIQKYSDNAKVVVITNPVDVITYCILKESGLPPSNIIGMGSSLDSDRFRYLLSAALKTSQSKIESVVLGEHGNSMVPIFSTAKLDGNPVRLGKGQMDRITDDVRNYWRPLIELKGASVFGAAKHSYDIVRAMIKNERLHIPSSVLVDGEYGLSDVCIGVPVTVDKNGASVEEIGLDEYELNSLKASAQVIRNNIKKI